MKKIIYIFILGVIFAYGCENIDISNVSDEDLERIADQAIVCEKPYIRHASGCCIDQDDNKICDNDENSVLEQDKASEQSADTESDDVAIAIETNCGDNVCDEGENCNSCVEDCGCKDGEQCKYFYALGNNLYQCSGTSGINKLKPKVNFPRICSLLTMNGKHFL